MASILFTTLGVSLMMEELSEIFWKILNGLPREGPGDNDSTKKAYRMLGGFPENPRIIDIGCGPGMQTNELAKLSGRHRRGVIEFF